MIVARKKYPDYCADVGAVRSLLDSTEENLSNALLKKGVEMTEIKDISFFQGEGQAFDRVKQQHDDIASNLETVKKASALVEMANNKLCIPRKGRTKVSCDDFVITKQAISLAPSGRKKEALVIVDKMEADICKIP